MFPFIGTAGQSRLTHEDKAGQKDSLHGNNGSEKRKGHRIKTRNSRQMLGNGISAFEPVKSSRPQGVTTLSVALTGHSISETALNLPVFPPAIFAPETPAHVWRLCLCVFAHDSEPALVCPRTKFRTQWLDDLPGLDDLPVDREAETQTELRWFFRDQRLSLVQVCLAGIFRCDTKQRQVNEGKASYAVSRSSWSGFTIVRLVPLIVIHWSRRN